MPVIGLAHATLLLVLLQKVTCILPTATWSRSEIINEVLRDPKLYYITTELACADGYPIQEHKVITADGYILTLHRIPNGQTRVKVPRREYHYRGIHLKHHPDFDDCIRESLNVTSTGLPVLFAHGIVMASDGWLLQGPGYDLAYLMADKGYDVWLFNVRGNFYSRQHRTLSPSDPKFWDFRYSPFSRRNIHEVHAKCFHENAIYDMPSVIDHILKVTKRKKIGYIGYSMGTSIFFAMASLLPEYRDKILGFVALAPVAFVKGENMNYTRRSLFNFIIGIVEELRRRKNIHELFPRNNFSQSLGSNYCSKGLHSQDFCYNLVTLLVGYRSKLVLRSTFPLYLTHIPAGTSLKTFIHFEQVIRGNSFRQFHYGTEANIRIYGTPTAPEYPVGNITTPVVLHFSKDDYTNDVKDIEELVSRLPNVVEVDQMEKFNHADFFWSYKAKDSLYLRVISDFRKFQDQYDLPRGRF